MEASHVEKFLGVDWSQYPLIAILLIVIFFAQKFYREDRAAQDARLDRVLDGYQKSLTNNTAALQALKSAIHSDDPQYNSGTFREVKDNG